MYKSEKLSLQSVANCSSHSFVFIINMYSQLCAKFCLLTQYFYATQLLFHDCRVDLAHIASIILGLNISDE